MMSNSADERGGNGTPRASHQSSQTNATLSPTWAPPKSPLPPHRLAKLANALGVSTPIPVTKSPTQFLSRSFSESSNSPIDLRRSPTPSATASSMGFSTYPPSTSKFLLHVIPPNHLPHDSENSDETSLLPPPNTPGYHTQFRRGTLVPVHSTLQAQLGAIAKEYALPSSTGLILYLITSSPSSPSPHQMEMEEPGPRLSEDIWRHLWTRVLRAEHRDDLLMPSLSHRSTTSPVSPRNPNIFGFAPAARSTPFLPQESAGLRPLLAVAEQPSPQLPRISTQMNPPPSTPSSLSEIRSNNKSVPPSSPSISHSEPDTPDTSIEDAGVRLDLPGLNSPSLIPILAKVEFDIDRRKATWYEPWIRSRKVNHAKRSGSRKDSRSQSRGADGEDEGREHAPVEFLTGKKDKTNPFGLSLTPTEDKMAENGYARLSESPEEMESDSDSETGEFSEDATAKISSLSGDIHAENKRQRKHANPNVVNLALTAEELDALPSPTGSDDDKESTKEEDEVMEMLDIMGKPKLAMAIPSPAKKKKRSSSPTSASRKVPPPLVLKPKDKTGTTVISSQPSPQPNVGDDSHLAYLGEQSDRDDEGNLINRVRSPDADKRVGAVFDDLDLGLDPTEDFDDPNDRRRSQLIMAKQLDEIERTMAQLSPRILKTDLEEDSNMSFSSVTLLPGSPAKSATLSPGGPRHSGGSPPLSPRLPHHSDPPDEPRDFTGQSWPAVPFSVIKDRGSETNPNAPPSPPRLAVNGVTTSAPRSYQPSPTPSTGPSESERRKKLEEEELGGSLYPANILPPKSQSQGSAPITPVSPVIPLSPDPFGRHPSSPDPPQSLQLSGPQWDTMTIGKGLQPAAPEVVPEQPVKGRARSGTTSRFSADSLNGDEALASKSQNRGTLMSVKSIRKLWRKSSNKSTSSSTSQSIPPTPSAPPSGRTSPMVPPQRPERPSEEQLLDLPDIPDMPPVNYGRVSPQIAPPVPRTSQEQLAPGRRPSVDQPMATQPANFGRTSPQTIPPRRDSMPQGRRPSTDLLGAPQPQHFQQLSVPVAFPGRANAGPITTPHMQAAKASASLSSLHFDQESPYPVRPMRQSPRPPSPPPLPAIPEKDKPVARKSILKWKSAASIDRVHPDPSSETQPRTSLDRLSGNSKGRRPSVSSFGGSGRSSVTSPDLPPSPQVPVQYINSNTKSGVDHRRSRLTTSSTDSSSSLPQRQESLQNQSSPPRSRASSRSSRESRPSFDVSQFEFVSPKAGMLGYPYNGLDQ